jgi:hypothetical protein
MKLARLIDPEFQKSLSSLTKEKLPLKVAYKLRNVLKKVEEQLNIYEDIRKEALNKYGKKKEDGTLETNEANNVIFASKEDMMGFLTELGDLTNLDVEMPTVAVDELGEAVQLSAEDIIHLDGFLID